MRLPARGIRNPAPGRFGDFNRTDKCRDGAPAGERADRKARERLRTVFRRVDRKIRQGRLASARALFGAPFPHSEGRKKNGRTPRRPKNTGSITLPIFEDGLVPLAGIEPARPCGHQILSLARLPIPPQGHISDHSHGAQAVNVRCEYTFWCVGSTGFRRGAMSKPV